MATLMKRQSAAESDSQNALQAWEEFIEEQVYPKPGAKAAEDYRNYDNPARDTVRKFYQQNHRDANVRFRPPETRHILDT